jgi:hypothetical protein
MRFTASLARGLFVAALPLLISCGGDGGSEPRRDTTPPTISSRTPAAGATGVAANATVSVTFSEPITAASVTSTTFPVRVTGGAAVPGTYAVSGSTATFTPSASLAFGTAYTAEVTTGVTDAAGNALGAASSWQFTVVPNVAPTATAGANKEVNRAEPVQLNGTGNDPEGKALSYRWTQTSGPDVTSGVGYLVGSTPTFTAPSTVSTVRFELRVTDADGGVSAPSVIDVFVMEDKAHAIFVSTTGDNGNPGTRALPVRTIQRGITLAATAGSGTDVYVAQGTYTTGLSLQSGVSVYGGYQTGTWLRDESEYETMTVGGAGGISVAGFNASNLTIDGFFIETPAEFTATGQSMIGLFLHNSQNITITNNSIAAGNAGPGSGGQFGFPGEAGEVGGTGFPAACGAEIIGGVPGAGGNGGLSRTDPPRGFQGGHGGYGAGPAGEGMRGDNGVGASQASGGAGGAVGSKGGDGQDGANGFNGADGQQAFPLGTLLISGYTPAKGGNGTHGTHGSSGGGGGGGGAAGGGGGGGGGGAGAYGEFGEGGQSGGGSFAIAVSSSTGIVIDRVILTTGQGGNGGTGGVGGAGGAGGGKGQGGVGCATNDGGWGGAGGAGGRGGHGGGGAGGPSVGIVESATSTTSIGETVVFVLGEAGTGGHSEGAPGPNGVKSEYVKLP